MHDTHDPHGLYCASDSGCYGYDHLAKHPAYVPAGCPLCDPCLSVATRDVRALVYAWLDLEQLQAPSLSQALDSQPRGSAAPAMPMRGEPEALQREIHHVTTLWAAELRLAHRLAQPRRTIIIGAWHTTVSNPPPPPRRAPGGEVQEAVATLTTHLRALASLPARTVFPAGSGDDPRDMAGWEAIHHLQRLRARARGMLGWTQRSHWVPGDCWTCNGRDDDPQDGPLFRAEPRHEAEEVLIWCDRCAQWRTWDDYQVYLTTAQWPGFTGPPPAEGEGP